jgi:Flp pilus assembly protein TadD
MAESAAPTPGRIFLSYRREETAFSAGWLYDRLAQRYGGDQVFKDVDSVQLGDDFVEVITEAVGSCDVLLAVIGDQWLTITGEDERRRLDDPDDFVRLEIEAALSRNVRVIPILVRGARIPRADELPPGLRKLVRRHALELSPSRFDFDTSKLLKVLDRTLAEVRSAQEGAASTTAQAGQVPDLGSPDLPTVHDQRVPGEERPEPSIPLGVPSTLTRPSSPDIDKPLGKQRQRVSTPASSARGTWGAFDFQVDVSSRGEQGYEVTARDPQGGEATASVRMPLNSGDLEALVARIKHAVIASSATVRSSLSSEEEPVQRLGRVLFDTLLPDDVRVLLEASREHAAQQGSQLRLVLRVRPPELARLPWEFLFDAGEDDYLCLNTPLIRYPSVPQSQLPFHVVAPLRILGMVAKPGDQQTLAVNDEKRRLEDGLHDLRRDGRVQLNWVAGQTWRDLKEAMHNGPWHIFHFIGHGGFDATAGEGTLALANDDGSTYQLSARSLAMLLRGHPSLRLVLLNACDTGRASALDPFSSVAGALMRRGIPAVLAMQFEITDLAAVEFSRTFYSAIAHQLSVDASVTEARQAIQLALPGTLEWGTPVLYLRSENGDIFDLAEAPAQRTEPEFDQDPVDDLYTDGLSAFYTERWDEAVDIFRTVLAHQPDHNKAAVKLDHAHRQQQLAARYAAACAAADAGAWAEAIEQFEGLVAAEPGYRDAQARLAEASREHAMAELRSEAIRLNRAKQWNAVLIVVARLKALDPDALDLDDLAEFARDQLQATERTHARHTSYQLALRHLEAGDWQQALAALAVVQALDPHYRDTPELAARARHELEHREVLTKLAKGLYELVAQKRLESDRQKADANDAEDIRRLGNALQKGGQFSEAEVWYRRASTGRDPEAMNDLGSVLEDLGRIGEAEVWYRQAAEAGNTAAMNKEGDLLEQRGEIGQAEATYRGAADAGNAAGMFNLADLLDQRGELDEAESWYRRAVDAGSTEAMNNLGFLLEKRGELDEADSWYRRYAELAP